MAFVRLSPWSDRPDEEQSSLALVRKAMGAFSMALELGIGIGSIVLGLLTRAMGYPAVFLTGAASALLGAVLCLPALRRP